MMKMDLIGIEMTLLANEWWSQMATVTSLVFDEQRDWTYDADIQNNDTLAINTISPFTFWGMLALKPRCTASKFTFAWQIGQATLR